MTIFLTALLSSFFTAVFFHFIYHNVILPSLEQKITEATQQAQTLLDNASPQISQDIADAIEEKVESLMPQIRQELREEFDQMAEEFLPKLGEEVESGVDKSFKKFVPTVVSSAATMPAETIVKTSSSLINTGLDILKGVTEPTRK